jgi:hypothetical protein
MFEEELEQEMNDIFHHAVFLESYYKVKSNYSSRKKNKELDYDPEEYYEKYNNIVNCLNKAVEGDIRERFEKEDLYNEEVRIKEKIFRKIESIKDKL